MSPGQRVLGSAGVGVDTLLYPCLRILRGPDDIGFHF